MQAHPIVRVGDSYTWTIMSSRLQTIEMNKVAMKQEMEREEFVHVKRSHRQENDDENVQHGSRVCNQ